MKKWITAVLAALLALSVSAAFVACGDGETPGGDGGNGGNTDPKSYTVTKTESDLYDYGWSTTTATAGTAAYVEVTPEYEAVSIAAVYYNGQACTKDAENEERYNFTMPAEDVTITVDVAFTDRAEDDDFLAWDTANETTVLTGTGTAGLAFTTDWNYTSLLKKEVLLSSDPSVIPNEALELSYTTKNMSSDIIGGTIKIDRSLIHPGTAQIVLALQSSNVTTYDGCIVCTVTVEEEPEIAHVDTWTETVVFQPYSVDTEDLYIQFEDLTYDETLDAPQFQLFYDPNKWSDRDTWTLNEDNMIEVQFEYVEDHEYSVTVGYLGETKTIRINDTTSTHATYKNDRLTFDQEGGSIRFSLSG